jgi:Ca2+/H+ antiporter
MPTWTWAAPAIVMLALTFVVSAVTLATRRTHVMQGAVHLVMFAAFLFLAFVALRTGSPRHARGGGSVSAA